MVGWYAREGICDVAAVAAERALNALRRRPAATWSQWISTAGILRATAIVLLLGLFAVPVSCAEASGPHSLFAPPDGQEAATAAAFHAHHPSSHIRAGVTALKPLRLAPAPLPPLDALDALALSREPIQLTVDAIPEAGSVVAVAIMALVEHCQTDLPSEREAPTIPDLGMLTGLSLNPDAPPPR